MFTRNQRYTLFVDGASRGNPGPSGAGVYFLEDDLVIKRGYYLGNKTNNQAEYLALLIGLFIVKKYSKKKIISVYSDSELLVNQMKGLYKIKKKELQVLHALVHDQLNFISCNFQHIAREHNQVADLYANKGIDEQIALPISFVTYLESYEIII